MFVADVRLCLRLTFKYINTAFFIEIGGDLEELPCFGFEHDFVIDHGVFMNGAEDVSSSDVRADLDVRWIELPLGTPRQGRHIHTLQQQKHKYRLLSRISERSVEVFCQMPW